MPDRPVKNCHSYRSHKGHLWWYREYHNKLVYELVEYWCPGYGLNNG